MSLQRLVWRSVRSTVCLRSSFQSVRVVAAVNKSSAASKADGRTKTELTAVRYPHIKRADFSAVTGDDVDRFRAILPESSQVLTDPDEVNSYNTDWMRNYRGSGQVVLRPKTTKQVSDILKYCNERRLAVVPQGGNTGLVGGSVPVFDEVVISTQLMNNIISLDRNSGVLTCQAGCILEHLNDHLQQFDLIMPLDLGAKGSCNIGGNVSTNAGGVRLLKYGSLHGSVLGLEVVTASGAVIDCLSAMRKDNVGYHMRHCFIGSEGTLGIVTAVSILCPPRPKAVNLAFLACESFDKVLEILSVARSELSEILSAFEFMDAYAMSSSIRHLKKSSPLQKSAPFYVLIETSGSDSSHDEAKLNSFINNVMENKIVIDGTIAGGASQFKDIWLIRESITTSLLDDGHCYKYDISLPLDCFYEVVETMRKRLAGKAITVCGFGHVGDGNLHFNATSAQFSREIVDIIEPFLYEYVAEQRGSISAEHGVGLSKRKFFRFGRPEPVVALMKQLKTMFDPNGILNPYKTLP